MSGKNNKEKTKKCPHCQTDIPEKATKCPNCQSDLRIWFRRHPFLTFLGLIFLTPMILTGIMVFSVVLSGTGTEEKKPDNTTKTAQSTPTPQLKGPLGEKLGKLHIDWGKAVIIQEQEIIVGEPFDNVAEKLGQTAVNTFTENDPDYGLIVEHQYKSHSILVALEPFNKAYYMVYDIYPNE